MHKQNYLITWLAQDTTSEIASLCGLLKIQQAKTSLCGLPDIQQVKSPRYVAYPRYNKQNNLVTWLARNITSEITSLRGLPEIQ